MARPDCDDLQRVIADYQMCHSYRKSGKSEEELPDDVFEDPIIYDNSDHDRSLALVALAMVQSDDPSFLGLVAAGLLEDIFFAGAKVSEEMMARIEDEARRTARFRWMLSGVWTESFVPEIADRVRAAAGDADMEVDPLPPRPWA